MPATPTAATRQSQARWMTFRAHPRPRSYLPLSVRSVGRYRVDAQWQEKMRPRWFTQLYWTFEGSGSFRTGNKRTHVQSGDIFIYPPGDVHDLRSEARQWGYCWLTLDHPQSINWVESFGLHRHALLNRACPQNLFHKIRAALEVGTEQGETEAAHCAHSLLITAAQRPEPASSPSLAAAAKDMIDESFSTAGFNIQTVADALDTHRSTLFRHFRVLYGITPVQYLGNLRLQQAITLINSGHKSIAEIARQTGFSDPNYLSRRISERTGMPARRIRQNHA